MGVPPLRLKLFAAVVGGGLMGMAGVPFLYHISLTDPSPPSTWITL
jgi:ABC-type branched-subunit amino acid transport system permease subunit